MNEINLDKNTLIQLGSMIYEILKKSNVTKECELTINVDGWSFKKIDEDIFYRDNENSSKTFEPSDNEILLKFHNLQIIIKKDK